VNGNRAIPISVRFHDRTDAGQRLAARLSAYRNRQDVIVLGLPRGGVPVALEVARELLAAFDVFLVRKLGVPGQPELAMGAIAAGNVRVVSETIVRELGIPSTVVDQVAAREGLELERRERLYRGDRPALVLADCIVIVIDDGLATGSTMEAAVSALRQHRPARIVVAVPVGAPETCWRLGRIADEVVCAETPDPFTAVGLWYEHFDQLSDDEVIALLRHGPRPS
jgi:putative phosphoribosyl transferase